MYDFVNLKRVVLFYERMSSSLDIPLYMSSHVVGYEVARCGRGRKFGRYSY